MFNPELVYKIRGVIFDVYNNIVGSWSEEIIENMLFDALRDKGLLVERQKEFEVFYKGNRVGLYRTDLIVEHKIILELKVVSEIFSLHQAQTISYLKVTGLPLGMLVNFGGSRLYIKIYPNNLSQKKVLNTNFDINKIKLAEKNKKLIQSFLEISKEILETLGSGYFHQVYRRAFWDELKENNIEFEWIKRVELRYNERLYGSKEVRFFKINDLLISIVAIKEIDNLVLHKFTGFVKYYKCSKGLIINFNNTIVDFRFLMI